MKLKVALALTTMLCALAASHAEARDARPNIVVIISDDHGVGDIGAYGNTRVRTPNIDALARDGIRFTKAFATTASCSPSRAALLTGRMPHNNGQYGLEHDESHFSAFPNVESLPQRLKSGGYRTARIGKYHVAPTSVFAFDTVLSEGKANQVVSLARSPAEMVAATRDFVTASDQPFFLYFATDDPHRAFPFEVGDAPNSFGNRAKGYPGITETPVSPKDVTVPSFLPDTPAVRAELAQYYQSVARLDQGVGALVALLKQTGTYHNTIILYLTDNGIAFPNAKTTLYDAGVHVPLIIRMPDDRNAGRVSDAMVSLVDVMPTLLDRAKLEQPKQIDGRSFSDILDDPARPGPDAVYGSHSFHEVQMYYPMRMVRTKRFKFIYNINSELTFPFAEDLYHASSWRAARAKGIDRFGRRRIDALMHRPKFELYDLQADPHEVTNLAGDPRYRAELERMIARTKAFQERTQDPWLRKWDFQ